MNKAIRYTLYEKLSQQFPNPTTELEYESDFELLISVILSAQATDKSVNKATKILYQKANTPELIRDLEISGLESYIKSIGLYRTKAKNVIATCDILIKKHNSQIPNNRANLEELPGVGRKTANVVLNTAFGEPTIAVDTHIFRVSNRTGLAKGKTPIEVENKLLKNTEKIFIKDAHHLLILHGRYICVARKPKCSACVIENECEYKNKALI